MNEIFIVSKDRFFFKKKEFFNSNKSTFTWIKCFNEFKKIYLIARVSGKKLKFKNKIGKIKLLKFFDLFNIKEKIRDKKILIISLTPFNFLVSWVLIILGANKKKHISVVNK